MPKFAYKILNKEDKIEEGSISSFFKRSAEKKLTRDGSVIIFISQEGSGFFKKDVPFLPSGFSATERVNFFRNFATMGFVGLSVVEILETLSQQVKSNHLKKAIWTMAEDAQNGQNLSETMSKFPKHFPQYIVETVNAGHISGRLNETFDRIANDLEKDHELGKKIQAALAYPIIVLLTMAIVIFGLVFYVLPEIAKLYQDLNKPLPQPTRSLLAVGSFLNHYPFYTIGTIILIIFLFFFSSKIKKIRYLIHSLMLKIPIFGELIKEYNLVIFFRSLESLYASGISLVQAVEVAKKTTRNDVYKKTLDGVNPILLRGVSFSDAIMPFPALFPIQTQKIVRVGEQTGKLREMLNRITKYFERSIDYKTRVIASLIEPIIMLVVGFFVAALALSIFLPIYQLVNVL